MSTHNLCVGAKIKKVLRYNPALPKFLLYSGVQGGIHYTDMFS